MKVYNLLKVYNLKYRLMNGNTKTVQIAAPEFFVAAEETMAWFQREFEDGEIHSIIKIEEIEGIEIVNLMEEICDCPQCKFDREEEGEIMQFKCVCGGPINCVGDWENLMCRNCQREITREDVVFSKGVWTYVPKPDADKDVDL